MMIVKTMSTMATADKLVTSEANYEKNYHLLRSLFHGCGRHADFVRIG